MWLRFFTTFCGTVPHFSKQFNFFWNSSKFSGMKQFHFFWNGSKFSHFDFWNSSKFSGTILYNSRKFGIVPSFLKQYSKVPENVELFQKMCSTLCCSGWMLPIYYISYLVLQRQEVGMKDFVVLTVTGMRRPQTQTAGETIRLHVRLKS